MTVTCVYCGEQYPPTSPYLWRRVQGWERKGLAASRRGGSDIALRERKDEYACSACIDRQRHGIAAAQTMLIP